MLFAIFFLQTSRSRLTSQRSLAIRNHTRATTRYCDSAENHITQTMLQERPNVRIAPILIPIKCKKIMSVLIGGTSGTYRSSANIVRCVKYCVVISLFSEVNTSWETWNGAAKSFECCSWVFGFVCQNCNCTFSVPVRVGRQNRTAQPFRLVITACAEGDDCFGRTLAPRRL